MPPISTVMDWLIKHKDFSEQYACAREAQADALFDDCIDIADTATLEEVQQARLRIDTRKWMAGKLKPKKYSDKITQEITGKDGAPLLSGITVKLIKSND